jgi:hypothetical protein
MDTRTKNASRPCSSGLTHSDRAVRNDANLTQIGASDASLRTLRGHAKCPLASGRRFVGYALQQPMLDVSSQVRQ